MNRAQTQRGHTLVEILSVVAMISILALITGPPIAESVRNSTLRAAARQIAGDVQYARSRAVGTGWQYRIAGVSAGAVETARNHYRIMARKSSAIAWPVTGDGPQESATLIIGQWVDLDSLYPGVAVNPTDNGEFALTFDPWGNPIEKSVNFDPLRITGHLGIDKWVTVSAAGNVRID